MTHIGSPDGQHLALSVASHWETSGIARDQSAVNAHLNNIRSAFFSRGIWRTYIIINVRNLRKVLHRFSNSTAPDPILSPRTNLFICFPLRKNRSRMWPVSGNCIMCGSILLYAMFGSDPTRDRKIYLHSKRTDVILNAFFAVYINEKKMLKSRIESSFMYANTV